MPKAASAVTPGRSEALLKRALTGYGQAQIDRFEADFAQRQLSTFQKPRLTVRESGGILPGATVVAPVLHAPLPLAGGSNGST